MARPFARHSRPPPPGAKVNPNRGLAMNMAGFYVFNAGVLTNIGPTASSVPPLLIIPKIGTPGWDTVGGEFGAGVTNADYFETDTQGPAPGIGGAGGGISFMCCFLPTQAGAGEFHIWSNRRTLSQYTGVGLRTLNSGTAYRAQYGDGGGVTSADRRSIDGSVAIVNNKIVVVSASLRGATDMSLYHNGVKDTATAYSGTGGSMSNGTNLPMRFSGNGQNNAGFTGMFYWVAFWNRNLSDDEHMQMALDPFGIVESPKFTVGIVVVGFTDSGTVYLDLQPSATDIEESVDSGTALLRLTPSAAEEFAYIDAGTLYLDLQPETCEIFVPRHQWYSLLAEERWETDAETRFTPVGEERWETGLVEIGDIAECQ
jgi:hypothetical protein